MRFSIDELLIVKISAFVEYLTGLWETSVVFLGPYLTLDKIIFWAGGMIAVTLATLFKRAIVNIFVRRWPKTFRRGPRWKVLNKWKQKAESHEKTIINKNHLLMGLQQKVADLDKELSESNTALEQLKIRLKHKDKKIDHLAEAAKEQNDEQTEHEVIKLASND